MYTQKKAKADKTGLLKKGKYAAVLAGLTFALTQLLLIAASAAIISGKLPAERDRQITMLCAFFGAFPTSLLMCAKEGRGVLKTAGAAICAYTLLLILVGAAVKVEPIVSVRLLESVICAGTGMLFGCAVFAFKKPKRKRKARRYNNL